MPLTGPRSRSSFPRKRLVLALSICGLGVVGACSKDNSADRPGASPSKSPSSADQLDASDPGRDPDSNAGDASVAPAKTALHLVGRFDTRSPLGPRFAWAGTSIRTRFSGTGVKVTLQETPTGIDNDQLEVSVDETKSVLVTTTGKKTYTVAAGLADDEHDLVLTKRTEPLVGTLQLLGIESTEGRPLVATANPTSRFIEFIGDSITCGYGVLGTNPCPFSAATEDETHAYGAVAAGLLGAAHAAISWSGIGAYRDFGGNTTDQMPTRFLRTLPADPTSTWGFSYTPDVVVVNLGTNDYTGTDPGKPFADAMESFTTLLRSKYPKAHLVIALSAMLTGAHRTSARATLEGVVVKRNAGGDAKVSFFEFDEQREDDGYGCDYHPSQATQRKSGEKLAAHLHTLTGW